MNDLYEIVLRGYSEKFQAVAFFLDIKRKVNLYIHLDLEIIISFSSTVVSISEKKGKPTTPPNNFFQWLY